MREFGPVEEAELVTAVVADFQGKHPGAQVASVEVHDLAEMECRTACCLDCGEPIAVCYWIQKCDACLEAMKEGLA
jgi:hypothetical protein